ncbi:protein NUCLEAR FUSION DEFECTIVE 4-like [Silene latifolia]|uniref:protein NUCLEAR FUSION DEFECTIVE 4-like n=1 Tax=Silene latifolia TaxID=37657 RepID=UPI003D774479
MDSETRGLALKLSNGSLYYMIGPELWNFLDFMAFECRELARQFHYWRIEEELKVLQARLGRNSQGKPRRREPIFSHFGFLPPHCESFAINDFELLDDDDGPILSFKIPPSVIQIENVETHVDDINPIVDESPSINEFVEILCNSNEVSPKSFDSLDDSFLEDNVDPTEVDKGLSDINLENEWDTPPIIDESYLLDSSYHPFETIKNDILYTNDLFYGLKHDAPSLADERSDWVSKLFLPIWQLPFTFFFTNLLAKDVGKAFGILAGLASDSFPTWLLLLIGSIQGLLGYGAQWLVVSKTVQPFPYWLMCIFMCMGGNSTTWMNTAILVTCIRNFRKNRGPVSGILKGYVGLSTAIFTDLCNALFSNRPAEFLMMLSLIPFAVCLIAMLFFREVPPSSTPSEISQESKYFSWFNIIAVIVAIYLLAYDFIGSKGHVFDIAFSVILLALLATPLLIPTYIGLKSWLDSKQIDNVEDPIIEPLLAQQVAKVVAEDGLVNGDLRKSQPLLGDEHTIVEAFKTLDFWVLFVSFLCGVGTGLTIMNNMGQMGAALGYSDVSIFVSLLSIMGFFGRIISGTVSEYCIKRAAIPRPFFNALMQPLKS